MSDAFITLVGNVASDPKHDTTKHGTPYTRFRFAQTPRRYDPRTRSWGDGPTSFYTVTCWKGVAENVANSVHRGDPVIVVGRQRIRTWKYEDNRWGVDAEVDAVTVGPDLRAGVSQFNRVSRRRVDQAEESDEVFNDWVGSIDRDAEAAGAGFATEPASAQPDAEQGRSSAVPPAGGATRGQATRGDAAEAEESGAEQPGGEEEVSARAA